MRWILNIDNSTFGKSRLLRKQCEAKYKTDFNAFKKAVKL